MDNNVQELNQKDADNKVLIGMFVLQFFEKDSYIGELKTEWFQQLAKQGLLGSFSRCFFGVDPEPKNIIPWFMVRIYMDLAINKNSDKKQFKQYIDKIYNYDLVSLETLYKITKKYNLDPETFKTNFQQNFKQITDKEDSTQFLFQFFADAIFYSEIKILGHCYEQWFREAYRGSINKETEDFLNKNK